jgi:hypothetical protein
MIYPQAAFRAVNGQGFSENAAQHFSNAAPQKTQFSPGAGHKLRGKALPSMEEGSVGAESAEKHRSE